MTLTDRFWAKTRRADCIVWTGAVNSKGYGCFAVNGVSHLAHRLAYEEANGPIPEGMTLDHLCRVRNCVNVAHLEVVSVAENIARARRKLDLGATCRNGHEITEANLYRLGDRAECRDCKRRASTAA